LKFSNYVFPVALLIASAATLKFAYYVSFLILAILILIIYVWREYDSRIILSVAFFLVVVTGFLSLIGDAHGADEIGIYAYPFFVLGIISWVLSYARKKVDIRSMDFMKSKYFPLFLITFFVALVGDYLRIWVGNPVGDDAFLHVGKVAFILNHFPNVNWYPYWFLGFDMIGTYPSAYYGILAITHALTNIPVPSLLIVFFFSSMVLLGFGTYVFSRLLRLPWYISVGLAVMLQSFPICWGWTVTGGAYLRSFALPFYVFSVLIVYYHTLQINSEKDDLKIFFIATCALAFALLSHLMIGFFTVITTILIYSLAVRGVEQKIKTLLKVFMPVCGLVSWSYLPILEYFITGEAGIAHEIFYESSESLFTMYNPVLIPLVLASILAFCLVSLKEYKPTISRERLSVVLVFLVMSIYFFLFGWMPMPESLYLMAAYDYRNWFGYSLLIFLIGILSLLYDFFGSYLPNQKSLSLKRFERLFDNFLIIALIVVVPAAFMTSLPRLNVMNINPDDPQSFVYYLRKDVDQIVSELPQNYRLAFASRRILAYQYYKYSNLEGTDGRQLGQLNSYYHDIFSERVFYRYPREYEQYYFEEQPHIRSEVPYMASNFFSSMFWLDWFAVRGVVIPPWQTQTNTSYEYTLRPQFFRILKSGGTISAQYGQASPIVMSTNASTLGIVVSDKYEEESYSEVLLTLGELNLNSQWVIPLKLKTDYLNGNLSHIGNLLVSPALYQTYKTSLEEYAHSGGHLIIMNFEYSGNATKIAELTSPRLHFCTYATPLSDYPPNSEVLAETSEGPVAYRLNADKGLITRSAVSIQELYEMATPTASLYLAKIIFSTLQLTEVSPILNTWNVRDREGVVEVSINQTTSGEVTLSCKPNMTLPYNQVDFATLLEEETSASVLGAIQFELWNDGKIQIIQISMTSTKSQGYLYYPLSDSAWDGWKTFSIPLASFTKKPDVDLPASFDTIVITPIYMPPYSDGSNTIKVKNLDFFRFEQNNSYKPLDGRWVQPNRFEISTNNGTANLLWKETYLSDWRIETVPIADVKYYYAGPGVIFAHFPQGVEKITFVKPLSKSQLVGIAISLSTFLSLIILLIYRRLRTIMQTPSFWKRMEGHSTSKVDYEFHMRVME